ncbi:MAG: sugar ABC transporter ATP-binding protein, partial [Salinibacterium sp.]|nr:sugar ABC transporter ATP-binding protein [Salinibacterium sp.]
DNGAGKSTLIKAISGVHQQDDGQILVDDHLVSLSSPADARAAGIATVFQDLALVECLDVSTNMFLGQFPRRGWFVDRQRMDAESRRFLDELKVTVADVHTQIGMLSGGQRQIISIARAVRSGAHTILLDEPTAALGVRETRHAADIISSLRDSGKAVICVSHDMEFVFTTADRILVLRLGKVAGVRDVSATTREEIIGLITGTKQEAA